MLLTFFSFFKFIKKNRKCKLTHEKKEKFIKNFCETIDSTYIIDKINDKNNKILFYLINNSFTNLINETVGVIIYRIISNNRNLLRIYISLISIHKKMRSKGYGTLILKDFVSYFKNYKNKKKEIVLLSLPSSYQFYKGFGFKECHSKYIEKNELINENIYMKFIF